MFKAFEKAKEDSVEPGRIFDLRHVTKEVPLATMLLVSAVSSSEAMSAPGV